MTREDLEMELRELRADVCVLFAREKMSRLEVDAGFGELLDRIDQLAVRAAEVDSLRSEQLLLDRAGALAFELQSIDKHRAQLFGVIVAANAHGILINNKRSTACIVPYDDIVGDRGNPTAGKAVLVQYFHGKCQLAFQNVTEPTEAIR